MRYIYIQIILKISAISCIKFALLTQVNKKTIEFKYSKQWEEQILLVQTC